MKYIFYTALIIVIGSLGSTAQEPVDDCQKAQFFFESFSGECLSSIPANNCIHLDITDSYDFEGKEFIFQWDMGDGTFLEGMDINHCYANPGEYEAVLSLLDPLTRAIMEDEATVNVKINGAFKLAITAAKSAENNQPLVFECQLEYPEKVYEIEDTYWSFDDGKYSCVSSPQHIYEVPGKYKVRQFVTLTSGKDTQVLCANHIMNIKMADPSFDLLKEGFDSIAVESRFLADDVHYYILERKNDSFSINFNQHLLKGGIPYRLLTYRGNLIFDADEVQAEALASSNDVLALINSSANSFKQTELLHLKSIMFELDQDKLSNKNKKVLKKNIELLRQFPMIQITIGVYTNSQGSLERGTILSLQRANLIKDYLIENGIEEKRLRIADPNNTRSLINSCVTGSRCDYADPALDRRADFKISYSLIN